MPAGRGAPQYLITPGIREGDKKGTVRGTQGEPKAQKRVLSWNPREESFKEETVVVKGSREVQSLKAAWTLVTKRS